MRATATAVATLALVFSAPLAAHASGWTPGFVNLPAAGDGSFVRWNVTSYDGAMGHVMRFLPDSGYIPGDTSTEYSGTEAFLRTACSGQSIKINGVPFTNNADFDSSVDSNGDTVITGTGTWALDQTIDDQVEVRVYAEGDLMRTTHVLTNNSGVAQSVTFGVHYDASDNVSRGTTSSGDSTFDTSDNWFSTWDPATPSMVYSAFWGSPSLYHTASLDLTDYESGAPSADISTEWVGNQTFDTVVIAPGAQYQWVFFQSNHEYDVSGDDAADVAASQVAATAATAQFADADYVLTGRLLRGLDATIDSNWELQSADSGAGGGGTGGGAGGGTGSGSGTGASSAASLAATGVQSDLGLALLAGLGLLGVGATVIVARRRAQRA